MNNQTWNLIEIYLSPIYFDMSIEGSIKEKIDELIYKALRQQEVKNTKFRMNSQSATT